MENLGLGKNKAFVFYAEAELWRYSFPHAMSNREMNMN